MKIPRGEIFVHRVKFSETFMNSHIFRSLIPLNKFLWIKILRETLVYDIIVGKKKRITIILLC